MSAPGRTKGGDVPEADKALVAVLAAAIVLLLFATNVQLWRLGSGGEAKGHTAATVRSALPPPVSGTSNDVLSKQLHRFSTQLAVPLNGLQSQLTGLQGFGNAQRGIAAQIKGMSDSIRRFGGVRGEIGQMTNGLGRMVANTSDMTNGLATMGRDMSATRKSMSGMVKVMRRVEGGIAATNTSSREASEGISAMRDATLAMAASISATAATSREMTASLGTLNQHMSDLVELFCVAFGSSMPACVTGEASPPAAVAPSPSAPEESSAGDLRQGLAPALRLGPAEGR
jgi:hypothetical protein